MDITDEIMYDLNSILIVSILFVLIMVAYEIGYRIGKRFQKESTAEANSQTKAIQAGVLGLLALLLGFTFNMSLQRYDSRVQAEIREANTIGTALLRTKLLPKPYDSLMFHQLQEYVDLRLKVGDVDLTQISERVLLNQQTDSIQTEIWERSIKAANIDPRPVTTGYFILALNAVIDARGERNAALRRHIPEIILFLLFIVFIMTGAIMGYSSGLSSTHSYVPATLMTLLIVLVVFIIIDLDRPKRGIIKVNEDNLVELKIKDENGPGK